MRALDKLEKLVTQLRPQFTQLEQKPDAMKQAMQNMYSSQLFDTDTRTPLGFLQCLEANIKRGNALAEQKRWAHLSILVEKISAQAEALTRLSASCRISAKESQYRKAALPKRAYMQAVKQVVGNSHELYAQLSQHRNWERELQEKLNDQQRVALLSKNKYQEEQKVLAYAQRLERCRKAIESIEYQIQQAESHDG